MLFGCCQAGTRYAVAMAFIAFSCYGSETLKAYRDEAMQFGKVQSTHALDVGSTTGFSDLGKGEFDASQARSQVASGDIPSTEVGDFLLSDSVRANTGNALIDQDEGLFHEVKEPGSLMEEGVEYEIKKCHRSGDPLTMTLDRVLNVQVEKFPNIYRDIRVCQGHTFKNKYSSQSKAKSVAASKEAELSGDSSVKRYEVTVGGGGALHRYKVSASWSHHDNMTSCDHYEMKRKLVEKARTEVSDEWAYTTPNAAALLNGPNYAVIAQKCVGGAETRCIDGVKVTRDCWKQKITIAHVPPSIDECSFLKALNCTLVSQRCLQPVGDGCALWEKTFKCLKRTAEPYEPYSMADTAGMAFPLEREQNTSLPDAVTKLAVFAEVKHELEASNGDPSSISIFSGKAMRCGKNVADSLMYDCCFTHSGLARDAGLAKCDAEEVGLAEMRSQGLCHYVGSFKEKFLGLWDSRTRHVFCCFKSKLARVVNEEGRSQLGTDWGSAKEPKCGGFAADQLARIDFTRMDLSELFEEQAEKLPNIQEKLERFQTRLEDVQRKMEGE